MGKRLAITLLQDWEIFKQRPLLIAGPCSAESEEQVMETARQLADTNKVDPPRILHL